MDPLSARDAKAPIPRPPIGGALLPERERSGTGTLLLAGAAGASALWLFLNLGMGLGEPTNHSPLAEETVKATDFGYEPETAGEPRLSLATERGG